MKKVAILNLLNKSFLYRYCAYLIHKRACLKDPIGEINRIYEPVFGRKVNLSNPQNLVEKIFWMEMYGDLSNWTLMADKYRMREYVTLRGCGQYLPKLYAVWHSLKSFSKQSWEELPSQFVIKANNGCGTVKIIKDKKQTNFWKLKKTLYEWLAIPYGYSGYQRHYLAIPPCIIAEELLKQDDTLNKLSPTSMVDFKIWSFNGEPYCILVTYNRQNGRHSIDLYDTQWVRINSNLRSHSSVTIADGDVFPKPSCLAEMLNIAAILSKGHPQMRVDFYIVNGKPVLGELTMASGVGSYSNEFYETLGSLTDISLMKLK